MELLTQGLQAILIDTARILKGSDRRVFIARTVKEFGQGGQRWAEKYMGWNRGTIRKGTHELESCIRCVDAFSFRGRKRIEQHLPNLLKDIKDIADPQSQTDATFRTTTLFTRISAEEVRRQLIKRGYRDDQLPSIRTIRNKLNLLGHRLRKVIKCRPIKKIPETDAIFEKLHEVHEEAAKKQDILRISIDTKATIKIGPFSRGGYTRKVKVEAADHDFGPKVLLSLFGIFLPEHNELRHFFTESKVTSDFIVDMLEESWPEFKERYNCSALLINMDNGPEYHSRRTQFIKRIVDFAYQQRVNIRLAYYPPYHSKYNPIERTWGVLENHWNGEILDEVETATNFAKTMRWNGKTPVVKIIKREYQTGVKLTKQQMDHYETKIARLPGLEKWFVDIYGCLA